MVIDIYSGIQKMYGGRVAPIRMRNNTHSFATHLFEDGYDIA